MNAQLPNGYDAATSVEADPRRAEALILSKLAAGMIRAIRPLTITATVSARSSATPRFCSINRTEMR